ncbi:uncharacterized protein AC631_01090 [Debaryomyces fabryi]|uniref:non-specific serine/threonine protein kinase n=1 Tax=Debaryomyces fabryi TaxID=58627 RepID=A0A0V1Q400_9ASCO|nr:uncharacterized protein AC631_01090 [Debaryomyces fabryi]KSA03193.1 hypothetical protein AC631_01090 [Debaryomyces fabryi]
MRGNKDKDLEATVGPQSPRGGDKKGTKFNFGVFLKKIPLPVNKRPSEEIRVNTEGQGDPTEFSLSPTAMSSPSEMVGLGSSGGNIIEENSNYTHEIIPVGDPSRTQQRYATFTSKCISLENSELTSQIDLDEHSLDEPQDSVFTHESRPPPISVGQKCMKKKPQNLKSRVNNNHSVTSVVDNPDSRGEVFENYQHLDNFEAYKRELAEEDDVVEYLSESESDLNVNPYQEENANDYKVGGYHPVSKGEVYFSRDFPNREYIILRKLGWGHFSTVWLAKSRYNQELASSTSQDSSVDTDDHYVAIKFVKSNDNYMEAAEDEIKLLKTLAKPLVYGKHLDELHKKFFENYKVDSQNQPVGHPGYKHIMRLLDDFEVTGPNGKHICMVFEILGENVLNLIFKSKTISKDLKHNSKSQTETKDTRQENNKNFKLFKSKLSLGLINNPKKEISIDNAMGCIKNNSSDSLTKLIEVQKTYGGIPLTLVKQIVKQMFLAVDYMHHCGIIHTDLKPENILIEIKDINNVIKVIENEKITKFNAKYKNRKDSSLSTVNINTDKMGLNRANSTNLKTRKDSVGYGSYRKSRNSVCGKCDSPVRTSKPLSSSINTDAKFQEVSFNSRGSNGRKNSLCKINDGGISPTNKTVLKQKHDKNDSELISIKIADFGNATFSHYHFTNQIQTRQYRAPEILLKHKTWGASADIWSIGCIIFELITGDYLFDPHNGNNFDKDEDHLAQIIELLGEFPSPTYLDNCELNSAFFDKDSAGVYSLKNISKLKYWSLHDVLVQKYKFDENDINLQLINDLILKCLSYDLAERYDCNSLANHPWLKNDIDLVNFDFKSSTNLPKDHSDIPGFTS